jgi:hypothetical protein
MTNSPAVERVPIRAAADRRRFPYPYRAMLAICSDLDETPDRHVYAESMRFLNTTASTGMGPGVGLEVGNSIYFDMAPGQFSYWNTDDAGRAMVQAFIRSGHIDCLHSYGDLATERRHAGRALDELTRQDCRIQVWVDHAQAPSNLGGDIMRGRGDVPGSAVYHADLTCGYGIRYVWRGRVTSVIGQGVPRRLGAVYDVRHPAASLRTVGKEIAKGVLARRGNVKYRMHADNDVTRDTQLRDGRPVIEFLRSNPSWRGVDLSATATGLGEVLTPRVIDSLVDAEGACILYTHLGKVARNDEPFPQRSREALGRLAAAQRAGSVLVTTTARLLDYWTRTARIETAVETLDNVERVNVHAPPAASLDGLAIYVRDAARTQVFVNGRERRDVVRNPTDHTGRASVSFAWRRLELPTP